MKWRDLLFLFCPSNLTVPNKSHYPQLCHPERTQISYFTALQAEAYAALRKESRMESTEATVFNRKSGAAEGPAVRPGSPTKVSVPLVRTQNRHPERSALTDLSRDMALVARSRRTSAVPIYPMLLGAFRPPKADCDTHLMVTGTSFHAL